MPPPTHPPAAVLPSLPAPRVEQECKITGGAGFSKTTTYGGGSYSIPLAEVSISLQP